jgi:hypothetical protein
MIALKNSKVLDLKLTEVFKNKNSVIIGFSFHSDIAVFSKSLRMNFYKDITNFIDL